MCRIFAPQFTGKSYKSDGNFWYNINIEKGTKEAAKYETMESDHNDSGGGFYDGRHSLFSAGSDNV